MDTLLIQGKFNKITTLPILEQISISNLNTFNRNIDWEELKADFPLEDKQCLVVPILVHQHLNGMAVFPHFRCHIVVDGLSNLLLQDISFEQWVEL
jgi:hypothetical protein